MRTSSSGGLFLLVIAQVAGTGLLVRGAVTLVARSVRITDREAVLASVVVVARTLVRGESRVPAIGSATEGEEST